MERKIGEQFEYNGVTLEVVAKDNCDECYFKYLDTGCLDNKCSGSVRSDEEYVIFKQIDKQMTKKDLKSGMIVETRNGNTYMVLTNCDTLNYGKLDFCLIRDNGFMTSDTYSDNLNCQKSEGHDIMEVFEPYVTRYTYQMDKSNLIWERPEPKETLTIGGITYDKSEVETALKDLKPIK